MPLPARSALTTSVLPNSKLVLVSLIWANLYCAMRAGADLRVSVSQNGHIAQFDNLAELTREINLHEKDKF